MCHDGCLKIHRKTKITFILLKPLIEMKTLWQKTLFSSLILTFGLLTGCENNSGQIEILTKENADLKDNYEQQLIENRALTQRVDSLITVVNRLESENQKLKGEAVTFKASTKDEKAIETLVNNLHEGWKNMLQSKDTRELLKYFLPKFTTGSVRVNTENIPSVKRSNNATFEAHLQELIAGSLTVSFGQNKFLYTEVKGDFFVTTYKTKLRVYQNNKQVYSSTLVTLLAGQNKDGWKVGSYNWVTLNY